MSINWNEMGSYITIEAGVPSRLLLKNWRQQDKFKEEDGTNKFGIVFDVWKENNFQYDETSKKDWNCTAVKACAQLKPIIEKAEAEGRDNIDVSVVKAGTGNKTVYTIKDMGNVVA